MTFGHWVIITGFAATLVSFIAYAIITFNNKSEDENSTLQLLGRLAAWTVTALVSIASIYLMYLILTHNFQVKYVYGYSSTDLELGYLISSFWAGQEGSFLFWTLSLVWMGVLFRRRTEHLEAPAMFFFNLVLIFFLGILIKASPFHLYDQVPPEGAGLNPLLQNPWMVIHPPILFIGYAAYSFPFALALAALLKRDYGAWVTKGFAWVVFAGLTLGAGIILGGFWAYEVLGWGGYWGWDPVENSSLIPWLTGIALIHGCVVQRRKGALQKTNIFLSILTFALVIYATFLTRSGVLENFSVHSFVSLGIGGWLMAFNSIFFLLGVGLFLWRFFDIPTNPIDTTQLNREMILLGSILLLVLSAVMTFVGTSSPIFTGLVGETAQVNISYYNKVNYPLGVLMGLFLALAPYLLWKNTEISLFKRVLLPFLMGVIITVVAFLLGMTMPKQMVFVFVSGFALGSNAIHAIKQIISNWRYSGAQISHLGVAIMFIGIIVSGTMDSSKIAGLPQGQTAQVMNYNLTFTGIAPQPNGKDIFEVKVAANGDEILAQPRMYNTNSGLVREPHIISKPFYDVYISPMEYKPGSAPTPANTLLIAKEQTLEYGGYQIHFTGFKMGADHMDNSQFKVNADLEFSKDGRTFSLSPGLTMGQNMISEPLSFPESEQTENDRPTVRLLRLNADTKQVELVFTGLDKGEAMIPGDPAQMVVQLSIKPFMQILWLGTIIMLVGFVVSYWRRFREEYAE